MKSRYAPINQLFPRKRTRLRLFCGIKRGHRITQEYWGGFTRNNTLYRRTIRPDGEIVRDEYLAENHAVMMYTPFLEAGENQQRKTPADE